MSKILDWLFRRPKKENRNYTRQAPTRDTILLASDYCSDGEEGEDEDDEGIPESDGLFEEELGELTIEHYDVSPELKARFRAWRRRVLNTDEVFKAPPFSDRAAWDAFQQETDNQAVELCRALALELPDRTIVYHLLSTEGWPVKIFEGAKETEIP